MSKAVTEARDAVERRLAELDKEREQLKQALAALGGPQRQTPPRASTQRRAPGRRRSARIPREQRERILLDYAKANPEARNSEIAKALKVSPAYVSQMLSGLMKTGAVKRRNGRLVVRG